MLNQVVPCLQFVDDTTLLASTQEGIKESLGTLARFCGKFRINLNWNKCSVTCFRDNACRSADRRAQVKDHWDTWKALSRARMNKPGGIK